VSDDHSKTKDELPQRPRGGHPYFVLDGAYFEAAFARCSQRWSAGRCWRQYAAGWTR